MPDIVICVDGTNSDQYKNSSVRNFYHSVVADKKVFREGPKDTISGADWITIRDSIIDELDEYCKQIGEPSFFEKRVMHQSVCSAKLRFILVGHSRGGHIAIHLAKMLRYRVHFMGLYDAVQRTLTSIFDTSTMIYNVSNIYHALRDDSIGSRTYFGNTGTGSGDGGNYIFKAFKTSHGGVGGDVLAVTNNPLTDADTSCAIMPVNFTEVRVRKQALCITQSLEADAFIKDNARKLGVRI